MGNLQVKISYSMLIFPGNVCVGGVVVNIVAFQAIVPGSIPGRRTGFFYFLLYHLILVMPFKVYLSVYNYDVFIISFLGSISFVLFWARAMVSIQIMSRSRREFYFFKLSIDYKYYLLTIELPFFDFVRFCMIRRSHLVTTPWWTSNEPSSSQNPKPFL